MRPTRRRWLQHLADSAVAAGRDDVRLLGERRYGMRVVVVETSPLLTGYATLEPLPECCPHGLEVALIAVRHLCRYLQATA